MMALTWSAIALCLTQSAIFSGLNLAIFSLSKLELEIEAKKRNPKALRVLEFRKDSNFTLVTILWGNVAVNVLLALLADSVLVGLFAFIFSTVVITIFAEIIPQAYFFRHALSVAAMLAPLLRFYQLLLFPVAKPTALVLDRWLGTEGIRFFSEQDMRRVIQLHMESSDSDIARMEGQGALNFLDIDDIPLSEEGEPIPYNSIIKLDFEDGNPLFPTFSPTPDDPFLQTLYQADRKWAVLIDSDREPRLVLNTSNFIADVLMNSDAVIRPMDYCHRPIIVREENQKLGTHLVRFKVNSDKSGTEVIDNDVILLWNQNPRIILGSDILGRLFRGIGKRVDSGSAPKVLDDANATLPLSSGFRGKIS